MLLAPLLGGTIPVGTNSGACGSGMPIRPSMLLLYSCDVSAKGNPEPLTARPRKSRCPSPDSSPAPEIVSDSEGTVPVVKARPLTSPIPMISPAPLYDLLGNCELSGLMFMECELNWGVSDPWLASCPASGYAVRRVPTMPPESEENVRKAISDDCCEIAGDAVFLRFGPRPLLLCPRTGFLLLFTGQF
jgi:hypothetical protein